MTKALERIWATPMPDSIGNLNLTSAVMIAYNFHLGAAQPYTRTDLYTAAIAERNALRAALADLCDKATSYGSQMRDVTETFNSACALNDMAASVRAARDLLSKGTPNAD